MRKEQVEEWVNNNIRVMKAQNQAGFERHHPEYIIGFNTGCLSLLEWLIQQGVIKGKLKK